MDKRAFLKTTGILGVATLLPVGKILGNGLQDGTGTSCTLVPTETAGPFPLDLTANNFYFRQDVREGLAGVQLNLRMKIIGNGNCLPMQNVRVNIWHCDKDGNYSGYGTETGLTYMRGYQMTDNNGEVEFITILPGWYPGRVCHIHFQVYVSSNYAAISQLTFDTTTKNAIYTANPGIYTDGVDPMTPESDGVFADGYQYQLATLTPNGTTGGYDSYLEVTVQGDGTTGYSEKEALKQFELGQNYPNPYMGQTTIPFTLKQNADVKLDLYDLMGRKVATINKPGLTTGNQKIDINVDELGLGTANYIYQMEITNSNGTYRTCKMMTALK